MAEGRDSSDTRGTAEAGQPSERAEEEGRPSLLDLLGRPEVRHVEAGDWVYREGDQVRECWYILLGRVAVHFGPEKIHELGAEEVLGAQELLVDQLEHNTSALAVQSCELIRMSLDGLVAVLSRGGLLAFLRRVAATVEHARAALRDSQRERDKVVEQLRSALAQTQDDLAANAEKTRSLGEEAAQARALIEKLQSRVAALQILLRQAQGQVGPAATASRSSVRESMRPIARQAQTARQALLQMTSALPLALLVELQQKPDFIRLHETLTSLAEEVSEFAEPD